MLAHINTESFNQIESQSEPNTQCTMWFIGLEFAKTENLNVDLTFDIHQFTETVNRQAMNSKILKDGMKLEARHVKRKQLHQYLSPSLLKRERKNSLTTNSTTSTLKNGVESRKRVSDTSASELNIVSSKKARLSEDLSTQCEDSPNTSLTIQCNDDSNSGLGLVEEVSNPAPAPPSESPPAAAPRSDSPPAPTPLSESPPAPAALSDSPPAPAALSDSPPAPAPLSDSPPAPAALSDSPPAPAALSGSPPASAPRSDSPPASVALSDSPSAPAALSDSPSAPAALSDSPPAPAPLLDSPPGPAPAPAPAAAKQTLTCTT